MISRVGKPLKPSSFVLLRFHHTDIRCSQSLLITKGGQIFLSIPFLLFILLYSPWLLACIMNSPSTNPFAATANEETSRSSLSPPRHAKANKSPLRRSSRTKHVKHSGRRSTGRQRRTSRYDDESKGESEGGHYEQKDDHHDEEGHEEEEEIEQSFVMGKDSPPRWIIHVWRKQRIAEVTCELLLPLPFHLHPRSFTPSSLHPLFPPIPFLSLLFPSFGLALAPLSQSPVS